jgi:hypothetical protein
MRKITWAIVAWMVIGIVGGWTLDAASHAPVGPAHPDGLSVPAWGLFEIWAIGFVLLGSIWGNLFGGGSTPYPPGPDRAVAWITRAILLWTGVWIVLVGAWALAPASSIVGNGPGSGSPAGLKPPDYVLFDLWLIGLVLLAAVALLVLLRNVRRRNP